MHVPPHRAVGIYMHIDIMFRPITSSSRVEDVFDLWETCEITLEDIKL